MDRAGDNRVKLAASREGYGFFESCCSGARCFNRRLTWFAIRLSADDDVFRRIRNAAGFERKIDNLWANAGAITKSNANAESRTRAHARNRNRS